VSAWPEVAWLADAEVGSVGERNGCDEKVQTTAEALEIAIAINRVTPLRLDRRKSSTPQRIRTSNLRFRKPMLYPVELGVHLVVDL
jgi:hypothetical protein